MPTLKELSILYAKKQPQQVDNITEDTPILRMLPFDEASHDLWNVYEEVEDVTGPGFVDLDAELSEMSVKSKLQKKDLSIMGGKASCGEDKAQMMGGAPRYFSRQEPVLLSKAGVTTEFAIIYNNIRAFAIAGSTKIDAGGSSNKNHCLLAVRFKKGIVGGLYSPKGFKNGAMLDVKAVNGGSLMEFEVTRNGSKVKIFGYMVRYKGYFGFQIASSRNVSGIFNIDRVSTTQKLPTAMQIDDLLANVRADNSNTYLFCHPKLKPVLKSVKNTAYGITTKNVNDNTGIIERWDDVPIVSSYNFLDGIETNVSFT